MYKNTKEKLKSKDKHENVLHGLFSPIEGKDIRASYPELKLVKEFNELTVKQFYFCWCYVFMYNNAVSNRQRIAQSIVDAYGNTLDIESQEKWKNGNIPEEIRVVIEKLENYDLSSRLKARQIAENQLNFFYQMNNFKVDDFKTEEGTIDWKAIGEHTDMIKKSNDVIPELVKIMEHSYGVSSEVAQEYDELYGSAIDEWHRKNQNQ